MEIKTLPVINTDDALLAEIIKTLRAGFGMAPAKYDQSMAGIEIPDDYSMGKKESPAKEPEVKEPKPEKTTKKETKAK